MPLKFAETTAVEISTSDQLDKDLIHISLGYKQFLLFIWLDEGILFALLSNKAQNSYSVTCFKNDQIMKSENVVSKFNINEFEQHEKIADLVNLSAAEIIYLATSDECAVPINWPTADKGLDVMKR